MEDAGQASVQQPARQAADFFRELRERPVAIAQADGAAEAAEDADKTDELFNGIHELAAIASIVVPTSGSSTKTTSPSSFWA